MIHILIILCILIMLGMIYSFVIAMIKIAYHRYKGFREFKAFILPAILAILFVICVCAWDIDLTQQQHFKSTTTGYAEEPAYVCNYHKQLKNDKQNIINKRKSYQKLPSLKFGNQQVGTMSLTKYNHYLDLRNKDIKAIHKANHKYQNDRTNTPFIHNKKMIYEQKHVIEEERQKFFVRGTRLEKSRIQKINHKLSQEHFTQYDIK